MTIGLRRLRSWPGTPFARDGRQEECMSQARVPVPVAAIVVIVATLLALTSARANSTHELVGLINAMREQPQDCSGDSAPPPPPLAPSPALALADASTHDDDLGQALVAAGYRAVTATTIVLSGASDAQRAAVLLRSRYCSSLRDRRFSEIGVTNTGDSWRINLAQPLLPADLADWREAAKTVLQLTNQARAQSRQCGDRHFNATSRLTWNDALAAAALVHSRDMAKRDYFSHADPAGDTAAQRTTRQGYPWQAVSENIAAGLAAPQQVVAGWLASPGHCANIMSADVAEMGAAYATSTGSAMGIYWTQVFGRQRLGKPDAVDARRVDVAPATQPP
jgi:uncharacterized protein YkwD